MGTSTLSRLLLVMLVSFWYNVPYFKTSNFITKAYIGLNNTNSDIKKTVRVSPLDFVFSHQLIFFTLAGGATLNGIHSLDFRNKIIMSKKIEQNLE